GHGSIESEVFMRLDFIRRKHRQGLRAVPNEEIVALLESGIEIEGNIKVASGMVRLNCQLKGAICSTGTVIVASQGDIEADIEATQVSIAGKVKGNVRASEQLEIKEQGVLLGDVETPSLIVGPGAYFMGHCDMPTGELEKSAPSEVVSDDRERA
ncbi:MAG: polymer-forming cytoskeletal protein, partial [Acidobacteria bacterium]|nr:polymer-forming cytoskeletal protein [Acidobacteriota bacterium]